MVHTAVDRMDADGIGIGGPESTSPGDSPRPEKHSARRPLRSACWPSVETTGCKTGIIVVPDSAPTSRQTPIKGNGSRLLPAKSGGDSRSNDRNGSPTSALSTDFCG
jgi:hypothetical protein